MADLRPAKLEKGTNVLEVLTWVEQVTNYIEAGYKNDPPDTGVFKFISPLLSDCWIQPLKQIRPETRKLKEITDAIEEEAKRNDPKHTRRVRYLHLKRGNDSHSDYAERLLKDSSVIEFQSMTIDELNIHMFAKEADNQMAKMALEQLKTEKPNFRNLINTCKEYESSSWYTGRKDYARMASSKPERFCKPCNSRTHDESDCWGECQVCHQRGHQTKYCRKRGNQTDNIQPERADKVAPKGKKKRNRRTGKRATVNSNTNSRRESEEEESYSEEDSPIKRSEQPEQARMARLNLGQSRRDLNDELSNLNEAEKKRITGSFRALRASRTDTSVLQTTAHSKIVGGRECSMDSIMDSGCSFPITSTAVAEGIGAEIKPLKNKLEIIDVSDKVMG